MDCGKTWACIGHQPTTWGLGTYDKDTGSLKRIKAITQRQKNGSWAWHLTIAPQICGNEPSNELAIDAAGAAYNKIAYSSQAAKK